MPLCAKLKQPDLSSALRGSAGVPFADGFSDGAAAAQIAQTNQSALIF
jgi:hypothetical protein